MSLVSIQNKEILSYTERQRIRAQYGKQPDSLAVPPLLKIQSDSYQEFLQLDVPDRNRVDKGLQSAFSTVFPISSYSNYAILEYVRYHLGLPEFDVNDCLKRGGTYAAPL